MTEKKSEKVGSETRYKISWFVVGRVKRKEEASDYFERAWVEDG